MSIALFAAIANANAAPTIQIGATVPYGVQPGLRVGVRQPIRSWDGRRSQASLIVGGDVASYVNPRDHVSGLLGATAGVRWQRDSGFAMTVEGGLAAVTDRQIIGMSVDLATGELERDVEWRLWMLPTVTGRLAWRTDRRLGVYTGLTVGPEVGFGRDGALVYTLDAGIRFTIGGAR